MLVKQSADLCSHAECVLLCFLWEPSQNASSHKRFIEVLAEDVTMWEQAAANVELMLPKFSTASDTSKIGCCKMVLSSIMDSLIRTPIHERTELHFLVDGLQVRVSYIDETTVSRFAVLFKWIENKGDSLWREHITENGYTFREIGSRKLVPALETAPERLRRLQRIWLEYQRQLGFQRLSLCAFVF